MVQGITRLTVAVLLVFALVGQALGTVRAPCSMLQSNSSDMGPGDHSMAGMPAMDHSGHAMAATAAKDSPMDCCGDAQCPMLQCLSSPSMFVASGLKSSANAAQVFWSDHPPAYLSAPSDSLYRPPNYR